MLNLFKDFLTFPKGERNGVIILLFVVFLFMLVPKILPYFIKQEQYDFSQFIDDIEEFERQPEPNEGSIADQRKPEKEAAFELFEFNPNNLPEEQWEKLGIRKRTIEVIKNYESKGGKFYKKSDLMKIYGFKKDDYERLEPFIRIPERKEAKYKPKKENYHEVEIKPRRDDYANYIVELNSADSVVLKRLRGIGTVLANRIIGYRELIGGFVSKDQLLEVYGVDSALFNNLRDHIMVDTSFVAKLDVNKLSKQELSKHPYVDYHVANSIVSYREQHGNFVSISELSDIYVIDEKLLNKLYPYLHVE